MAYNRKMRKFEGTCYIPGEQLAMMAKYYRGANLNLNLTLFEDDLATMQETLDQACWCSKLDEVDRMKMSHMKGNEWRIQHDHCLEEAQLGPGGRNPKVYPALPQSSRSTVGKVERGTSAVSLYDRERGLVRGGRYQKDDFSEPRNRRDDYYDRRTRRDEYYDPRYRRAYYPDSRNVREDYDKRYRRDDYSGPPVYHAQVHQNEKHTGRNMGGPPDRRYDMESEAAMSSLPEVPGEIRCAVCNVETCLVCKNHLYSPICQCKCPVANAGLCNKCSQEPCEEEEDIVYETRGNKMDMSSMMLTMMMNSMFKQSQAPESVCCCKPSRDNSASSSSDSSEGKVHKVYLYDCEDPKKNRNPKKKSKKASSDSSSACDCCKCAQKPKKNSGKKELKTSAEETSESDSDKKHQSTRGKGSSNRKPKGGDKDSDTELKPKGSKESTRKSTAENRRSIKGSKEDDAKSVESNKHENVKALKMKDENRKSMSTSKGKTRGSKTQGSIDSRNVQFSNTKKSPTRNTDQLSSSESDAPKKSGRSPQKSPPTLRADVQMSELLDTQDNIPELESSNHRKKDGDADGVGEESSTTFSLKDFIVCLPKIQSNLQSLMYKLNQMDILNNLQYPHIDPTDANPQFRLGEMQIHRDVPLISPPQHQLHNTSGLLTNEHTRLYNQQCQKPDSEISIGYPPANLTVSNSPPSISPGSSKEEPKVLNALNPPTRYSSNLNFSNVQENPEPTAAGKWNHVPHVTGHADSTRQTQSMFKISPLSGAEDISGRNENQWSLQEGNRPAHAPSVIFPNNVHNKPQGFQECDPTTRRLYKPGNIFHHPLAKIVNENDVQPLSTSSPRGSGSQNIEIIELPDRANGSNQGTNLSNKSSHKAHNKTGTAVTTSSRHIGETIFQSYKHSSAESSNQDLTDYASFADEKDIQISPATSAQQATDQQQNKTEDTFHVHKSSGEGKISQKRDSAISKCSRNNRTPPTLHRTKSVFKAPRSVTFKAKQRAPLALEKLVQGCTVKSSRVSESKETIKSNVKSNDIAESGRKPRMKLLDQGVGPGKFRRSKSDSSLDTLIGTTSTKNRIEILSQPKSSKTPDGRNKIWPVPPKSVVKNNEVIPLKKKISISPIKAKARHGVATKKNSLLPRKNKSLVVGKFGFQNVPSDHTTDQSDSILKMSDAYVRQEIGCQSYIVSSVEVKTFNDHGSSTTDILKVVQGIANNSLMNMKNDSSGPPQTVPSSSDDFDIIPLLPMSSTTPADGSECIGENQSGTIVKKRVSFDNDVSPNTPAFLRKSRVQVEQLKRAHETIRSMIKNVNEVIAHIDSDSKIGIKSKARSENERQSCFVHLGDDENERQSLGKAQDGRNDTKHVERQVQPESASKPSYSSNMQNREVQEMFLSVNRVINSVLTPSEQSNDIQESHLPSESTTPSRVHRDFFVLNSDSSSTAFTESLRRSLENDTSRSVPLATQRVPSTQRGASQWPRLSRPLKRRSWFPPPKQ